MPKVISYCHNCGRVLPLWKIRCVYCHRSAFNWMHAIVLAVLVLPALLLIMRLL